MLYRGLFATLSAAQLLNSRSCVVTLAETFLASNLQMGDGAGDEDVSDSDEDADIKMEPDDEDEFKPIDPAVVAAIKARWKAEEEAAGVKVLESDEEEDAAEPEDVVISDAKDLARDDRWRG